MTDGKPQLKVSVISDYVCPFCFIGHRRLARLRDDYDLRINWCLVEIHPETPVGGMPLEHLGFSAEHWRHLVGNLQRLADEEGIEFRLPRATANSRRALLLAEACKSLGADIFYPLHERLFDARFVKGEAIDDIDLLKQIAAQCRVPEHVVEKAWSDPYTDGPPQQVPSALIPYLQFSASINARNVPTFVFDKELLTGVTETAVLRQAAAHMSG